MTEGFDAERRQDRARIREVSLAKLREIHAGSDGKMQDVISPMLARMEEENAKANQEDAEVSARRADEIAAYTVLVAKDAKNAWDSGSSYYLPVMPLTYDGGEAVARAFDAETALAAVRGVGWKLHTWTVDRGRARPLFSRE